MKMDTFQPVGSFKMRGIGHLCQIKCMEGAAALVSSSGGNAGYAAAYSGRKLGVPVTVVVPASTPEWMRGLVRREKATVIEHGASWAYAHAHALELVEAFDAAYIHPFDDPLIWQGHASMIEEMYVVGPKPGAIVVAVGGAGLLCGVIEGMERVGWTDVPVVTVETEGAASFAKSVEAGELITLDSIDSIATTLGAIRVTPQAMLCAAQHPITPWVVSDRAALDACKQFVDDHRILVEPACGAALAAVYNRADPLIGRDPVMVIVCGGAGVSLALLDEWEQNV
jgi:L-serine/L-threonine ammonia-lyase